LSLFVAFLTAFYTFRAFFMTFHGEEIVPHEVGDHAHESPQIMTLPLIALAVCAVLVGGMFVYDNFAGNRLFDFIGQTPSLAAGAIAETKVPGKFHLDVAALSTIVAVGGIVFAMYLYMGDRSEAVAAQHAFDLQGLQRYTDVQWVARLKQVPLIAGWERGLRSIGLGWLVALAGWLLGIFALMIAIPFTLGTFVTPYRLSLQKFFFDELYVWFIVRPCELLADIFYWLDKNCIDALVNFCGQIPRQLGNLFRALQMGLVQFYAVAMLLGAIVLLTAGMLWGAK
jgi:NADH-quinone oxidoreductase subunit L